MSAVTESSISLAELVTQVTSARRGAVVTFTGQIRNHQSGREVVELEYSAYLAMAERECAEIQREATDRWHVSVALRHRIGRLQIGDIALAVAVAGDHRGEAFDACRWLVDEVKHRVPIWKHERFTDGTSEWVDPTLPLGR